MSALPKSLERLQRDPRIREVWSEQRAGHGYWVETLPGYGWPAYPVHCMCRHTAKELLAIVREMRPCNCEDCARAIAKGSKVREWPAPTPKT